LGSGARKPADPFPIIVVRHFIIYDALLVAWYIITIKNKKYVIYALFIMANQIDVFGEGRGGRGRGRKPLTAIWKLWRKLVARVQS